MSDNLENAISKKSDKIEVDDLEIIVTEIIGTGTEKPYYEIKYHRPGNDYYNVGFSSYNLQTVRKFKNECFVLVPKKEVEVVKVEQLKKKLEEYAVGQCTSLRMEQVEISIERVLDLLEECKEEQEDEQ